MSDISSLQARLSQEQARNSQLRAYVAELASGIISAENRMSTYQNKVKQALSDSNQRMNLSHEHIIRAHEIQADIDKMYVRFKNMELANKKIRECNNRKYYDFASYNTVRKIVQGMLDNLNVNMISDAVIYKSVEKEHLKTPDYWLTSVLLGIMAWKNDDRLLAERAIEVSVKLDKKNSAIFYMLFNIRMGREDAALKWFFLYQECELKGSDQETFLMLFSLLSKTLKDDVNDKIKYEVIDFINKVIALNAQSEGFSEEQILDTIENDLKRMKDSDRLELNMLKRCLSDYSEIADIAMSAENNIRILQFIMDVGNVSELEKNEYLDQFIKDEIAKPNEAELSVYDEIEYNELVISCNGDMERTEAVYQERQEKKHKELNLIAKMMDWIYNRGKEEINGQVRKNMFTLTVDLQEKAAARYVEHYRSRVRDVHPVALGDYSTEADFQNRDGEGRKISAHYEEERDRQLGQIKYMLSVIGALLAAAGAAGVFYLGLPSLAAAAVGAALAVCNIVSNSRQKKHIMETCELNIRNKNELMDQLFGEYRAYKRIYAEYDAYYDRIIEAFSRF